LIIARNAPLSISEKIVLQAAAEQGKWKIRHEYVSENHQLISDSDLVDQAIQTWTERVGEYSAQNNLYKEANLHSILYRYAQFSNDYKGAYTAISKMCETDEGLAAFLRSFKESSFFDIRSLALVDDPEKLTKRITSSTLNDKYQWLIVFLRKQENISLIREQATQLKQASEENM
jgi:hypothetical protein